MGRFWRRIAVLAVLVALSQPLYRAAANGEAGGDILGFRGTGAVTQRAPQGCQLALGSQQVCAISVLGTLLTWSDAAAGGSFTLTLNDEGIGTLTLTPLDGNFELTPL